MKSGGVTMLVIISVLAFVTTSVACRGIDEAEAVRDVSGKPVKPNIPYYIQVAGQPEKWVSRDKRYSSNLCPQVAVLSSFPTPVIFLQELGVDYIPINSNISIRYEKFDPCLESGIWKVDKQSPFPRPDVPASGAAIAQSSTFTIQKHNDVYKFVYESDNIGLFTEPTTYIGHLVVNPTPLDFNFVPTATFVDDETSSFMKTTVPFIY